MNDINKIKLKLYMQTTYSSSEKINMGYLVSNDDSYICLIFVLFTLILHQPKIGGGGVRFMHTIW